MSEPKRQWTIQHTEECARKFHGLCVEVADNDYDLGYWTRVVFGPHYTEPPSYELTHSERFHYREGFGDASRELDYELNGV